MDDENEDVTLAAAAHPSTPVEAVRRLATDTRLSVRAVIALRVDAPAHVVTLLASDTHPGIRSLLALSRALFPDRTPTVAHIQSIITNSIAPRREHYLPVTAELPNQKGKFRIVWNGSEGAVFLRRFSTSTKIANRAIWADDETEARVFRTLLTAREALEQAVMEQLEGHLGRGTLRCDSIYIVREDGSRIRHY